METNFKNNGTSGASTNVMGSGIRSVISPGGKSYYVLEHRATSRFHQAGEQQKIIVDNVVIGRDSSCQVRFDDDFNTVSRKHASIVRDGDRWKLIQLSTTNSTFVNGVKVVSEQYLSSGDEIQVSANGPKLVFIIPGNASQPGGNMGNLGLTARLQLYSQQALKPYRRALIAGGIALLLAIGGLVWILIRNNIQEQQIADLTDRTEQMFQDHKARMDSLAANLAGINDSLAKIVTTIGEVGRTASSAMSIATAARQASGPAPGEYAALSKHVYFIQVVMEVDGQQVIAASGTGFMLKGGKFVTARHCVDFGYNMLEQLQGNSAQIIANTLTYYYPNNTKVHLYAVSGAGKQLHYEVKLNGGSWRVGNTKKAETVLEVTDESGETIQYPVRYNVDLPGDDDWAYIQTDEYDGLDYDASLSRSLQVGTPVSILGFPRCMGVERLQDTGKVYPQLDKTEVCYAGLYYNGTILLGSEHIEHGNSGGPAFSLNSAGKPVVIGIVSGLDAQGLHLGTADQFTNMVGRLVPICALK